MVTNIIYILFRWSYVVSPRFINYTLSQKQKPFSWNSKQFKQIGGEYRPVLYILTTLGITFRHSCSHTHQQGKEERKRQYITEMGLIFLSTAKLPYIFWWDVFVSAIFTINSLPSHTLNPKSPLNFFTIKNLIITFSKCLVVLVFHGLTL